MILTHGLGLVFADVPVDVVAIAFSVGDSFGGSGADELAYAIRNHPSGSTTHRIVAPSVWLSDEAGMLMCSTGRYVSDYLRVSTETPTASTV